MKILFDQGVPVPLRRFLSDHEVTTAYEINWSDLSNGDLIESAEQAGFQVLITTDQNLRYQQNLESREIAIVVLLSTSWPKIQEKTSLIVECLDNLETETYIEITIVVNDREN